MKFPLVYLAVGAYFVFLTTYVWIGACLWRTKFLQRTFGIPLVGFLLLLVLLAWSWWAKSGVERIVSRWTSNGGGSASDALARAGQAGDLFGGFNALFAAFAFVGAVAALWFQSRAMQAAQRQLTIQQDQMTLQAFEPMFVHLLESHRRLAESLQVQTSVFDYLKNKVIHSTVTLENAAKFWHGEMDLVKIVYVSPYEITKASVLRRAISLFEGTIYKDNAAELGRYFRSLYHVFKFVKTSNLTARQKIRYSNMARATLGSDHLALLALNCLSGEGRGFVPLVEEYGLLKHLIAGAKEPLAAKTGGALAAMLGFKETAWLSAIEREKYWEKNETDRPGDLVED